MKPFEWGILGSLLVVTLLGGGNEIAVSKPVAPLVPVSARLASATLAPIPGLKLCVRGPSRTCR